MIARSAEAIAEENENQYSFNLDVENLATKLKLYGEDSFKEIEKGLKTGNLLSPNLLKGVDDLTNGKVIDSSTISTTDFQLKSTEFNLDEAYVLLTLKGGSTVATQTLATAVHIKSQFGNQEIEKNLKSPIVVENLLGLIKYLDNPDLADLLVEQFRRPHFGPIGVGDLRVVKQRLKRYELGEIAHIENVLKSELRVRDHRFLNRSEVFSLEETESTTTTEQDLKSEERFELSEETSNQIQEEESLEAGVSVSAQFGPYVKVDSNLDYSSKNSKEQANKKASQYSKELTERSLKRVQDRVLSKRSTKNVLESETKNRHEFNNVGPSSEHIVGVYRYVDKIYEAQLLNKGKRLLFEFIVPEPARWLSGKTDDSTNNLHFPEPPGVPEVTIDSILLPENSGDSAISYEVVASNNGVNNPPLPPEKFVFVSARITDADTTARGDQAFSKEGEILIPEGYQVNRLTITISSYQDHGTNPYVAVTIGGQTLIAESFTRDLRFEKFIISNSPPDRILDNEYVGKIGYTAQGRHDSSIAILIEVQCERTARSIAAWKQSIITAIWGVYNVKLERHNADINAIKAQGRSDEFYGEKYSPPPARLREIERTELKRRAIEILGQESRREDDGNIPRPAFTINIPEVGRSNWNFSNRPLIVDNSEDPYIEMFYPDTDLLIDVNKLEAQAPEIRFAEQAFEWTDMTYTFYPYYWANPNRWRELSQIDHNDKTYGDFLRAGSARIVVSVRPGFEKVVHHFLATGGKILAEAETPDITDKTWFPIWKEIQEQQGYDPSNPELLDCWEVKLPTNLVMIDIPDYPLPDNGDSEACLELKEEL